MKRTLLTLIAICFMAAGVFAASDGAVVPGTMVDSATSITTTYSSVDTMTIEIDDATNEAILFVSGTMYLFNDATGYVAVSTSTTGSNIILGDDTLFASTERMITNPPGFGNPASQLPFFFTIPIDHDSVGVDLTFYLNAKKGDNDDLVKLYDVQFDAITNLENDSL